MPSVLCLFLALWASLLAVEAQPAAQPANPPWQLLVMHPSLDWEGLYTCSLTIPAEVPINEVLGLHLILRNPDGAKIGGIPLAIIVVDGQRIASFSLGADLIKKSIVAFQLRNEELDFITLFPGEELTIRRVEGQIVREPIE